MQRKSLFLTALVVLAFTGGRLAYQKRTRHLSWPDSRLGAGYVKGMALGFVPGNGLVSIHIDEQVRNWTLNSGQANETFPLKPFFGSGNFTIFPVISPDGKWAAGQGMRDINFPSGVSKAELQAIRFSENNDQFNQLFIWDLKKGKVVSCLKMSGKYFYPSIAFSIDGNRLAVGGNVIYGGQEDLKMRMPESHLELWDWKNSRQVWQTKTSASVKGLSWANNDQLAVIGAKPAIFKGSEYGLPRIYYKDGEVAIWNTISKQELMHQSLKFPPEAVALSRNGEKVVVGQGFGGAIVLDAQKGALLYQLECPMEGEEGGWFVGSPPAKKVIISGDNRLVAALDFRGIVKVWKLANAQFVGSYNYNTVNWKGESSQPNDDAIALSDDGDWLAKGSSQTREIIVYPLPQS